MKEPQDDFHGLEKFKVAISGVVSAFRGELSLRIQLSVFAIVVVVGVFLGLNSGEWTAIVLVSGLVFSAEIMNTAIECLCDTLHPDRDPEIGRVKDIGAGAVLVAALAAAGVGAIVFLPKIWELTKTLLEK